MRFLTRYTPSDASGVLIATGGIMPNAANGMRIKLANGAFEVRSAPSSLAQHAGG